MVYVLDTSSFIHIGHFFPDRFPTFWDQFDELVEDGRVISVREARSELETQAAAEHLFEWVQRNREIFHTLAPTRRRSLQRSSPFRGFLS